MNTQSNKPQKGFTLIEVIVVAVIVAILAAVAIPIYEQYVTNASNNSAKNAGGSVASFCGACMSDKATLDISSDPITCSNKTDIRKPSEITITVDVTAKTVSAKGNKGDSTFVYYY